MRISYAPTFTSNCREVTYKEHRDVTGNLAVKHRNTTCFYRSDLNWDDLVEYLDKKYAKENKINTYCYACSDGSEPYSFIMKMISKLGNDKADKFFPIEAKDYDSFIIDKALSKRIGLVSYEPRSINDQIKGSLDDYMEFLGKSDLKSYVELVYAVKDNLFSKVHFTQANVLADVNKIKPDNSVVFCRNFWPYLRDQNKINSLAQSLYQRLGNNSCVILGDYDQSDNRVFKAMKNAGFNLIDESLRIFEKFSSDAQTKKRPLSFVRKLFL